MERMIVAQTRQTTSSTGCQKIHEAHEFGYAFGEVLDSRNITFWNIEGDGDFVSLTVISMRRKTREKLVVWADNGERRIQVVFVRFLDDHVERWELLPEGLEEYANWIESVEFLGGKEELCINLAIRE